MNEIQIHNPVEQVKLETQTVEMRQLPFLKAFEFTRQLSKIAGQLFDENGRFVLSKKDGTSEGGMEMNLKPLEELISQSGDLTSFLLIHSARKDQKWLEELSTTEGLTLLQVAIRLNLSPEILSLGKEVAASLAAVFTSQKAARK